MTRHKLARRIRKFEALEDRRLLTTFHVTTVADVVNPNDGKISLREAIDLANAHPGPDVVVLKAGPSAYKITIAGGGEDNNETGDFDITDDLTIKSAGSGFPTISGNGLDRVFHIPNGSDGVDLTLNHVIVTGGIARSPGSGRGGGVSAEADNNTISIINNASIKNNISTGPGGGLGGGIYNQTGSVNVINSHVDNNSAAAGIQGLGGGIYLSLSNGAVTITNSTVNNNSAYQVGGGIYSASVVDMVVTNSQINNNHVGESGGGIYLTDVTSITFKASSVSGNTAGNMGALCSSAIVLRLTFPAAPSTTTPRPATAAQSGPISAP